MTLRSAALSDIGKIRKENEDRLLCDTKLKLYGVADGIGGLPYGGEAAQMAVDILTAKLLSTPEELRPKEALLCMEQANRDVLALGRRLSPIHGLGTTLTCGFLCNSGLLQILHVGDSRCYLLRSNELLQLTTDHNVENELKLKEAMGETTQPVKESMRSALTRCLGQIENVRVDLIDLQVQSGDRVLFCTDGITRMILDNELCSMLAATDRVELSLRRIVELALARGGYDNASGVLLHFD